MLKVALVRHGVSTGNLAHMFCGRVDVPLAPEGLAGLRALKGSVAYPAAGFYACSPLLRCRQTFAELFGPKEPDLVLEGLAEADFGEMDGRVVAPADIDAFCELWLAGRPVPWAPGCESCEHLRRRAVRALAETLRRAREQAAGGQGSGGPAEEGCPDGAAPARAREPRADGKPGPGRADALIVTHAYWIRGAVTALAGLDASHWYDFPVANGRGYVLELEEPGPGAGAYGGGLALVRATELVPQGEEPCVVMPA